MDPWVGVLRTTGLWHPQRAGWVAQSSAPDSGVEPCLLSYFWHVATPSMGRGMDKLHAFSGAPGILELW